MLLLNFSPWTFTRGCPMQVTLQRVGNRNNANDMESQWFYRWLQATWPWHVVGQFAVLFALGGLPALVWGGALRIVWVYHITWFVNSASHVWGNQTYNTGDLSRNNWWVWMEGVDGGCGWWVHGFREIVNEETALLLAQTHDSVVT